MNSNPIGASAAFAAVKAWSAKWPPAHLLLLIYNQWRLFVRVLKEEGCHREAITRRDDLLVMPAKLVESGRPKKLKLSVSEKWWTAISLSYLGLQRGLGSIAPQ